MNSETDKQKEKRSIILLIVSIAILLLSFLCFIDIIHKGLGSRISFGIIAVLDFYVILTLVNAARSRSKSVDLWIIGFPSLVYGVLIFLVILLAILVSFSTIYINSGDIVHNAPELKHSEIEHSQDTVTKKTTYDESVDIMTSRLDAFYFSLVTMTTLGYGDYIPATRQARLYAVFQIFTSLFLLAGGFSLLISRITSYSQTRKRHPPATVEKVIERYSKRTIKINGKNTFMEGEKYYQLNKNGTWKELDANEIAEAKKAKTDQKIRKPMTKEEIMLLYKYINS